MEGNLYTAVWKSNFGVTNRVFRNLVYYAKNEEEVIEYIMKKAQVKRDSVVESVDIILINSIIDLTIEVNETNNI